MEKSHDEGYYYSMREIEEFLCVFFSSYNVDPISKNVLPGFQNHPGWFIALAINAQTLTRSCEQCEGEIESQSGVS